MSSLSAKNLELLELLNTYRFLTSPQLLRLGFVQNKKSIYRIISRFSSGKRPYIGKKDFGFIAGKGRLHRVFYLEKRGAKLLETELQLEENEIHLGKTKPPYLQDYFHRVATIDFHIELDRFAAGYGCEVRFFHTYFDHEGANLGTPPSERLRKLTKVPLGQFHIIPDGIFLLEAPDGLQHLFALEIYNGKDTKRVHKQLQRHLQAQEEGAIAESYGLQLPYRVLLVFETESAAKAVMQRIREDSQFSESEPYFAFNTLKRIQQDFVQGWWFFSGKVGTIF